MIFPKLMIAAISIKDEKFILFTSFDFIIFIAGFAKNKTPTIAIMLGEIPCKKSVVQKANINKIENITIFSSFENGFFSYVIVVVFNSSLNII